MTEILKKIKEFNKQLALIHKSTFSVSKEITQINSYRFMLSEKSKHKKYFGLLMYQQNSLTGENDNKTNRLENFIKIDAGNYILTYNIGLKNIHSFVTASIGVKENDKIHIIKNSKTTNQQKISEAHLICTVLYSTTRSVELCVILNNNHEINNDTFCDSSILSIYRI